MPMRGLVVAVVVVMVAVCSAVAGCVPTLKPGFDSPDASMRMDAAVKAAGSNDRSSVPGLVRLLDADDPATRLIAIRSLERLTGTTLGYDHAGSATARAVAAARWQAWAAAGLKEEARPADPTENRTAPTSTTIHPPPVNPA